MQNSIKILYNGSKPPPFTGRSTAYPYNVGGYSRSCISSTANGGNHGNVY